MAKGFKVTAGVLVLLGLDVYSTSRTRRVGAVDDADVHIAIPIAPPPAPATASRRASTQSGNPDALRRREREATRTPNTAIPIAPPRFDNTQRRAATSSHATTTPQAYGTAAAYARQYAAARHGTTAATGTVYDDVTQMMMDLGSYFYRRFWHLRNRDGNTRDTTAAENSLRNSTVGIEINEHARPQAPAAVSAGAETVAAPSETVVAPAESDESHAEESDNDRPARDAAPGEKLAQTLQKYASAPEMLLRRRSSGSMTNIFCGRSPWSRATACAASSAAASSAAASSAAAASAESNNQKPGLLRRRATAGDAESLSLLAERNQQAALNLASFDTNICELAKDTKAEYLPDEFFLQCMFCLSKFGDVNSAQEESNQNDRMSVSYEPTIITRCGHKFHVDCLKKQIEMRIRQKMQQDGVNPLADTEENNRIRNLMECPHPFCKKKISKKWAKENGFLENIESEMAEMAAAAAESAADAENRRRQEGRLRRVAREVLASVRGEREQLCGLPEVIVFFGSMICSAVIIGGAIFIVIIWTIL